MRDRAEQRLQAQAGEVVARIQGIEAACRQEFDSHRQFLAGIERRVLESGAGGGAGTAGGGKGGKGARLSPKDVKVEKLPEKADLS